MSGFDLKDIKKKIINTKQYLKNLSTNFKINFSNIENYLKEEVFEIEKLILGKKQIIPEINYSDICNNITNIETNNLVKKRGCVVIRNVFNRDVVNKWNKELGKYI